MEEKSSYRRKLAHMHVFGEFQNLRRQQNRGEKTDTQTEYTPNHNCQQRSDLDTCICHQQVRAGQRGVGYIMRP